MIAIASNGITCILYFITFGLLLGFGTACTAGNERMIENSPASPTAVYFTVESDALLSQADLEQHALLVVTSKEQLEAAVAQHPDVTVLYFHPETVNVVDDLWLRKAHYRGLVIAALNTPLSAVAGKLGVEPEIQDLSGDRAHGRLAVAVIHTRFEPGRHARRQMTEYFSDFAAITHVINRTFLQ
jgi:hypothetical protein